MRRDPFEDSPEFRRLLDGDERADLTCIALEIAQDAYPGLDPAETLRRIDELAERVRTRLPSGGPAAVLARPRRVLGHINWVLFTEEGFRGNATDYYDPRNSYLNDVLDRRTGIPISLSALYLAIADRVGLAMAGVNLPGHFVLRTGQGGNTTFVDPFHDGELLDRAGCLRRVREVTGQAVDLDDDQFDPCPTAVIVARMLRNLKAVYLKDGEFEPALPVMRRLVALGGSEPLERRDLGVACLHAERAGEAIDHLEAYLDARPQAEDAEIVTTMLKIARREVAAWN